jgi:UDP-N-acetylglucosamine:LPS N-acetylglucosamine transferase
MSDPLRILFFSRGRGRGHAIPDIAIADELKQVLSNFDLQFASYATGADTFRRAERAVHDLDLPESNPYLATLAKCFHLIQKVRPQIVICHEEFAGLVAARLLEIPSIFVSAWLPSGRSIFTESIHYCGAVVILERPGIFALPPGVTIPVYHVGPILRNVKFTRRDREALRVEMGITNEAKVVIVMPGGYSGEEQGPIAPIVLPAFHRLASQGDRLFWISSKDFEFLRPRVESMTGVTLVEFVDPVERLLAIADIVITKGTCGCTLDAMAVGVPSISLSLGINPMDDLLVPRIRNNISLFANATSATILADYIERAIVNRREPSYPAVNHGAKPAALAIVDAIRRLVGAEARVHS